MLKANVQGTEREVEISNYTRLQELSMQTDYEMQVQIEINVLV